MDRLWRSINDLAVCACKLDLRIEILFNWLARPNLFDCELACPRRCRVCLDTVDGLDDSVSICHHAGTSGMERLDLSRGQVPGDMLAVDISFGNLLVRSPKIFCEIAIWLVSNVLGHTALPELPGIRVRSQSGAASGGVWQLDASRLDESLYFGLFLVYSLVLRHRD